MATPPRITRTELAACLTRIANRRAKVDDPSRELLPDDPNQPHVGEVLDYLRSHSPPDLPRWVLQADVVDALTLNTWLWWEDRRREHYWLTTGVKRGLFLSQLGAPLGISSRAGVNDRIDRLTALLHYDRPDEQLTRAGRRQAKHHDQRLAWVAQHRTELRDTARDLLAEANRYQVTERDWLDELDSDLSEDHLTPATLAVLGMAAAEVATCPAVATLDAAQPRIVHRALARAEQLRTQFARMPDTPPAPDGGNRGQS